MLGRALTLDGTRYTVVGVLPHQAIWSTFSVLQDGTWKHTYVTQPEILVLP